VNALRILIVDDHPLVRRGLRATLAEVPDLEVVGEATTGQEAVAQCLVLRPDIVLMDLQMPGGSGIEATRQLRERCPESRVLVLTLLEDDESVFLVLRAGARGYVVKDTPEEDLVGAIRAVGRGEAIFSPAVATRVLAYFAAPRPTAAEPAVFPNLTEREREILDLIAQGQSNPSIARRLALSPKTVANYVSVIFGKLQVADRAEAIVRARDAGLGRT
jgi:DNA-binding NarL/FixJ family response regulator